MTDIGIIRTLTGDPIQYDRAVASGDGDTREFELPNSPVVSGSEKVRVSNVIITDYTLDLDLGLLVFGTPPASEPDNIVTTYKHSILSDNQIQALLDMNDGDVLFAASDAVAAIAQSELLIQKKLKLLDIQTDGPALQAAMMKYSQSLYDQALGKDTSGFEIIEQINDVPGWWEKIYKDFLRSLP